MDIKITPRLLHGTVQIPASKSVAHRMLIGSALAQGASILYGFSASADMEATIQCLSSMGAGISIQDDRITVTGIPRGLYKPGGQAVRCEADCGESGSTLRFLIPIAAALSLSCTFHGRGKLPERPLEPYLRELPKKGVRFQPLGGAPMPFTVSGTLEPGRFELEGNISSQFITGLLMALPLLQGDSEIVLLSPLQSKPYADMTLDCLSRFGIKVRETAAGYQIPGGQEYRPVSCPVEGDYSQAAFFFTANALGSQILLDNLPPPASTFQGDRKILEILEQMGYNQQEGSHALTSFTADAAQIPDLAPILAVLGCFGSAPSHIYNTARLRIKESDRVEAISSALRAMGGKTESKGDTLTIYPVDFLQGGTVDSRNDHRIVMAAAIASTRCRGPVIIRGAEAVSKSYPAFFEDFKKLGGIADGIHLES